jgi:hypothetical protein
MALEIRDKDVAEAMVMVAEAEGVVTINKTTINTTAIKTAEVVSILLERHCLATRGRLSSRRRYNHSHLSHARQMAHEDSPLAEGSRKRLQPVHPLINLNLEFGYMKNGTR